MSLFTNLYNTYSKCKPIIGIIPEGDNEEVRIKKTFLPLYHMTKKTKFAIVINQDGKLQRVSRDEKEKTIIIPCTEASASRANSLAAHGLCDDIGYIDNKLNVNKFAIYKKELEKWKDKNLKVQAIYNFVTQNSFYNILLERGLILDTEKDENNIPKDEVLKYGVRFIVNIPGDMSPNVWEDRQLYNDWIETVLSKTSNLSESFDYITGNKVVSITVNHPKNINSFTGNAKLMSCNDNSGYTYRGRFNKQDEAIQVDTLSSQKIHQTLRWLIKNFGYYTDTQVMAIWAIDEDVEEKILPFEDSFGIVQDVLSDINKTENDILQEVDSELYKDYAKTVGKVLQGYCEAEKIKVHTRKIAIAIFDAATTGRMGVTFYQELPEDEYLEKIVDWHNDSSWMYRIYRDALNGNVIMCPSLEQIIRTVYRKPAIDNDNGYKNFKKITLKQLMECMFGNVSFPKSLVLAASYKVSSPLSFKKQDGSFDKTKWEEALSVACSLIKKYEKEKNKEEFTVELEKERCDRDYLYGRLLAVADKIERTAMYKKSINDRTTNAIRLMNAFSVKPSSTWLVLWQQLLPYVDQLGGAKYYQKLIGDIIANFKDGDYESNKPLGPVYLLGYFTQNRALYQKEENKEE